MDNDDLLCVWEPADGANSFTWNADADESANAWDKGRDYKVNPL